ncbi:MAG: MBOAT family O-acyltransferase [Lachnospiraceae bacterium]
MVFNSYLFVLVFLPLAVAGYHMINKTNHFDIAKVFLLCMSLWFYGYQNIKMLPVLLMSILFNYALVMLFFCEDRTPAVKKGALITGILFNLLSLFYFKYLVFFEVVSNKLFGTEFTFVSLLLPLGVSFFTFQQIAYLIDSYGDSSVRYRLLDYALFVSFFPKITVGPIALSTELIPQFNDSLRKKADYEKLSKGLLSFSFGLAKKVLLADTLANYADWGFSNIPSLGSLNAFLVMLAYTMQIYFDFSGYCDMASGICLMLNFDLPVNFDSPYKAKSIAEFWKRWHMTLTRFFRTYVYFPLGGNRKGRLRTYLNMFLIFFLSGLWHGAADTFLIWGMIHGAGICLSKLLEKWTGKLPVFLRWLGTFLFVNLAWIYFRAPDLASANAFFKQLFSFEFLPVDIKLIAASTPAEANLLQWLIQQSSGDAPYASGLIVVLAVLAFSVFAGTVMKNTQDRIRVFRPSKGTLAVTVLLLVWSVLSLSEVSTFIYVNF